VSGCNWPTVADQRLLSRTRRYDRFWPHFDIRDWLNSPLMAVIRAKRNTKIRRWASLSWYASRRVCAFVVVAISCDRISANAGV